MCASISKSHKCVCAYYFSSTLANYAVVVMHKVDIMLEELGNLLPRMYIIRFTVSCFFISNSLLLASSLGPTQMGPGDEASIYY